MIMETITDILHRRTGWFITGGVACGALLYWRWQGRGLPPGPRGWPIVGATKEISGELHLDSIKLADKYGNIFSFYSWGRLYIVLNDLQSSREAFTKYPEELSYRTPLNGILLMGIYDDLMYQEYGEKWKADRKFALTTLRSCGFGTSGGERRILNAVDGANAYLQANGVKRHGSGIEIDILEMCQLMSASVILGILIGEDRELTDPGLRNFIADISLWWQARYNRYYYIMDKLPKWLCPLLFPGTCRKTYAAAERLRMWYKSNMAHHASTLDPSSPRDVVDGYLTDRPNMSEQLLANNFLVFTIDAVHTLSAVVTSCIFFLTAHPEVQSKVRKQIEDVVGSRNVTVKDKASLPFLEATISETFRLMSPITMALVRTLKKDIFVGGQRLPKGALVTSNYYNIHMDPKIYEKPKEFNLYHFLDPTTNDIKKADALFPFGMGRRSCIGEQLARQEVYVILANLLQKYHFRFPPGYIPPADADVISDQSITRAPPPFTVIMYD